jgi:hypothetical protein
MQVLHAWFCALYIDLLAPAYPRREFLKPFRGILQMNRYQQKRIALGIIKQSSDDPQVLANPKTEPILIDS